MGDPSRNPFRQSLANGLEILDARLPARVRGPERSGNPTRRDKLRNGVLRDRSRSGLTGTPNKHALHGIANDFASNATRPADSRTIKAFTLPPLGITSRGVHCGL